MNRIYLFMLFSSLTLQRVRVVFLRKLLNLNICSSTEYKYALSSKKNLLSRALFCPFKFELTKSKQPYPSFIIIIVIIMIQKGL